MTIETKTRSTVYIENGIWKEVRQLALDEGTSATQIVKEALKDLIQKRKPILKKASKEASR